MYSSVQSPDPSGLSRESNESAQQSRNRLRLAASAPPLPMSSSFFMADTLAFCTSGHSIQPPTRLSYICCVFDAFFAWPRRLISCVKGLGSMANSASLGARLAVRRDAHQAVDVVGDCAELVVLRVLRLSCPMLQLQGRRRNELAALDFTRSTHLVHSLGSARDRDRREWRSACAMRVNCSAPGCSEGTPGHSKTTQRRECDALGRQTCARAGTRGVDRFSKTAITRRCAVWGCFWGPWASYLAGAQTRLPQRSRGSARQRASRLAVKVT